MKQIFFTFVATTLFWFGFYRLYTKSTEAEAPVTTEAEQPQTEGVARMIGQREPVEEAEPIESKRVTPPTIQGNLGPAQEPVKTPGNLLRGARAAATSAA